MADSTLRERWNNISEELRAPVEAAMGVLPRTTLHDVPLAEALPYATTDAVATLMNYGSLLDQIQAANLDHILAMDMGVIPLAHHIQQTGMLIDLQHFSKVSVDLGQRIGKLDRQMFDQVGHIFNPDSPDQISELLFDELQLHIGRKNIKRTSTGRFKADAKALAALKTLHPLVPMLIERRKYSKLKGTFVDKLPLMIWRDGRLHTNIRVTRVPSGRFCIAKGSLVETVRDVSRYPLGVPIEDVKVGDLVYSFDRDRKLCLRKVTWAGKTGTKHVVRIHWQGTARKTRGTLDLTPEHEVRLVDGTYKAAGMLQARDSIMALSRRVGLGYALGEAFVEYQQGLAIRRRAGLAFAGVGSRRWKTLLAKYDIDPYNHSVVAVEHLEVPVDVYDLEVEDTHCFIANQLCVHNSSHGPNLQQIPAATTEMGKAVRTGFIAPDGYVYCSMDLSGIEMRTAAHLSHDKLMLEVTRDPSRDIHYETAARIFGKTIIESPDKKIRYQNIDDKKERHPCKRAGFLILYGGTAAGLSDVLISEGLPQWTEAACEGLIKDWFKVFGGFNEWVLDNQSFARMHGYVLDGFGRRIWVPQVWSSQRKVAEEGLRLAQNAPCQGTAAGVLKLASALAWRELKSMWAEGKKIKCVMTVHDELIFEHINGLQEEVQARIQPCFEKCTQLAVPIVSDCVWATNWGAL